MSVASPGFWETLPLGRDVQLLTHDVNGLAAFAKPAGTLSHPNESRDRFRALLTAHYDKTAECFQWPVDGALRRLWLLNRLDSGTSGVILAAADAALAAAIRAHFREKRVHKVYQAIVFGKPRLPVEIWRDLLSVSKKGGQIRTGTAAGNIPAESRMQVVQTRAGGGLSLLQLEPRTGRSHQLRVQCAKRNLPIVNDQTYGDFKRNRAFAKDSREKRLFLHSLETKFEYEWAGSTHTFSAHAPLPEAFERVLR